VVADLSVQPNQPRIGRYIVESKLGEGGMAESWLCRLEGTQGFTKHVVIKTLKADCRSPEFLTMFADEARIGSQLEHPNIPRVIELGQWVSSPFMVQEYVEGPSVFQILQQQSARGQFDLRFACRLVIDVARALHYAHNALDEQGRPLQVVHRDVSPSNILVSRRGVTKLIDFGVAVFLDRETRTQAGVLKGKLRYMAPELLLHGEVSHQSDMYSLGVVLYSLCAGEPPWGSGSATSSSFVTELKAGALRGFPPPSSKRSEIDPELDSIVMRCLDVDRTARFASGKQLEEALEGWLAKHGGPVPDSEVAERLVSLYPHGPSDWRPEDLTVAALRGTETLPPPPPSASWSWVAVATLALGVVPLASVLLLVVGLSVLGRPEAEGGDQPSSSQQHAPSATETARGRAKALLDESELALSRGDLVEAASQIALARLVTIEDPELEARRAALEAEIRLQSRILSLRELARTEPAAALEQARALSAGHPDHPGVLALLSSLPPPIPASPVPGLPPPRPRPPDDLLGKRTERAPTP
jgi:serine/threonine protein kinase